MSTHDRWWRAAARYGYGTKGLVHGLVGVLGLRSALGMRGGTEGSESALRSIGAQPFGRILLALTAAGLAAFVLWRLIQVFADPDGRGRDWRGLLKRGGLLISAGTYSSLAFAAARRASTGVGKDGGAGLASDLMSSAAGRWTVAAIGIGVLCVGISHFLQAWRAGFTEDYQRSEMSARSFAWARAIGRLGLAARGVTFSLIGAFLVHAAWTSDVDEKPDLGAAFGALEEQAFGPYLLGAVALGFIAYGLFCLSYARYRDFGTLA